MMLRRMMGPFQEFGVLLGLLYLVGRVLSQISPRLGLHVYELTVQPIPTQSLVPVQRTADIQIRELQRDAPELDRMPAPRSVRETRFNQGARCLGAFRKERLIGYLWLCFAAYDEDEVRCTYVLAPNDRAVFDFDLYILPEYRMGRGFIGIWNGVNEYLRERSIQFTFSRITRFNLASRRAHAHLGYKKVAGALFVRLWNVQFMIATIWPFVHLSLRNTNRVRLHLTPDVLRT